MQPPGKGPRNRRDGTSTPCIPRNYTPSVVAGRVKPEGCVGPGLSPADRTKILACPFLLQRAVASLDLKPPWATGTPNPWCEQSRERQKARAQRSSPAALTNGLQFSRGSMACPSAPRLLIAQAAAHHAASSPSSLSRRGPTPRGSGIPAASRCPVRHGRRCDPPTFR